MAALLEKDVGVDALKDEMAALLEKDGDALKAAVEPHFAAEAAPTQAEVQNHEAVQARAEEPAEEEDEPAAAAKEDERPLPATESSIATADAAPEPGAAAALAETEHQRPRPPAAAVVPEVVPAVVRQPKAARGWCCTAILSISARVP